MQTFPLLSLDWVQQLQAGWGFIFKVILTTLVWNRICFAACFYGSADWWIFWFCTILSWSTQSLTWFSEYLSQKSYNEHESRMNSHLNWLYTCNPLGCLREIYQTSHLSLQLQVYLLKEWAPSIVFLFLYNMPSLDSFFLTVFLFHFIEVEAKHKIPQCPIRMCDHRLLWTLEIKLSITVLKVSPGG